MKLLNWLKSKLKRECRHDWRLVSINQIYRMVRIGDNGMVCRKLKWWEKIKYSRRIRINKISSSPFHKLKNNKAPWNPCLE